eukprot:701298-Prymnesium_polylepis.1
MPNAETSLPPRRPNQTPTLHAPHPPHAPGSEALHAGLQLACLANAEGDLSAAERKEVLAALPPKARGALQVAILGCSIRKLRMLDLET